MLEYEYSDGYGTYSAQNSSASVTPGIAYQIETTKGDGSKNTGTNGPGGDGRSNKQPGNSYRDLEQNPLLPVQAMTALYELTGLGALYNAGIQWLATGIKLGLKKAGVELAKKEGVILADDAAGGISLTKHGAERLAGVAATRGGVLSIEEVKAIKLLVQKPIIQGDGAKVFIHEVTPGRFSGFIENQNTGKLITTMNNWSKKSINKMGKNHGWSVE